MSINDEPTRYPQRGEFGDPTHRCHWCGKPISRWRDYCSIACSAACHKSLNYIALVVGIIFIPLLYSGFMLFGVLKDPIAIMFIGFLFLGLLILPLYMIQLGRKIRNQNRFR